MYLLDTNIISVIAPARQRSEADEKLADWIAGQETGLFLSVVTASEIEDGIAKARRVGATRKALQLTEWWGEILHYYGGRILPVDLEVARLAGQLMDRARAAGIDPGYEDVAIAATGLVHSLTVVTRNFRDFRPLGAKVIDPHELPA